MPCPKNTASVRWGALFRALQTSDTTCLVEARIPEVVDASHHRRDDMVVLAALEVAVEVDALPEPVHGELVVAVGHGEVRLKRRC